MGRREELAARRAALREAALRRRRRMLVLLVVALVLLGALVGGGVYLVRSLFGTADFDGPGEGDVVVRVLDGDTTRQIGTMLARRGVVASADAFVEAAAEETRVRGIQPGYYQVRLRMSGAGAVAAMIDPGSLVGRLEVRGGLQLDDTRSPDGAISPGLVTLVSEATCARLDGERRCVGPEQLREAMTTVDPAELGVPEWAVEDVRLAEPGRRLEGLVAPGIYDVAPGVPAVEVWRSLLVTSADRLREAGIGAGTTRDGRSAYQLLIMASLVEKEGITADMPKVARVLDNRLAARQRLELDSTVNYPLDVQALRTTAEARATPGPYNSYQTAGLPPTPIAAAGGAAIGAALQPEPGPWMFFVRCRTDGTSCFAVTLPEHQDNVREAIAAGAF